MTQLEIKQKIENNNQIIESLFTPNQFTLNNTIRKLLAENAELQKQCVAASGDIVKDRALFANVGAA